MNAGAAIVAAAARGRRQSQPGVARRRNAADGRIAIGQSRRGRVAARQGRRRQRPRGRAQQTALMWAAAQRHPEVVKLLVAHGADVHARSSEWQEMMAVPPHGVPQYNKIIPHGRDTALLFAARSGDLESAKLLVGAGANVNDADAWGVSATTMAAHAGFTEMVELLLDRGADASAAAAGFSALACRDHAARYADGERTARARRRSERAAQDLDADAPIVARLQLRARARRRDAVLAGGAVQRARRDAPAAEARRQRGVRASRATTTTKNRSSRARRSRTR